MLEARNARILDGDADGETLHVEWVTDGGETVVGIYEMLGWTTPPKKTKARVEAALWVPLKK